MDLKETKMEIGKEIETGKMLASLPETSLQEESLQKKRKSSTMRGVLKLAG